MGGICSTRVFWLFVYPDLTLFRHLYLSRRSHLKRWYLSRTSRPVDLNRSPGNLYLSETVRPENALEDLRVDYFPRLVRLFYWELLVGV